MAAIKTKITNILPKPKDMALVNFEVDRTLYEKFSEKLKEQGVKKTDFFRSVIAAYLKE